MWKKIVLIITAIILTIVLMNSFRQFNGDFATNISVKYHYMDENVDTVVTEQDDINEIKQLLKGPKYKDTPSCGFSTDISITLLGDRESITLCPACDGCPILQIDSTDSYIRISKRSRNKLNTLLKKYGMSFPCI